MGTFEDDLATDNDAVFLDATGYGFSESVNYRARGTAGSGSAVTAFVQDQVFAIYDSKQNKLFVVSEVDVAAPVRGDLVIESNGDTWQVVDIQTLGGMHELRCSRQQNTQ